MVCGRVGVGDAAICSRPEWPEMTTIQVSEGAAMPIPAVLSSHESLSPTLLPPTPAPLPHPAALPTSAVPSLTNLLSAPPPACFCSPLLS